MVRRVRPLKLVLTLLVLLGVVFSAATADAARKKKRVRHYHKPEPYVEKYAAIVLDASTGKVLHEEMSHATRYPASLTKMMTLYMLFEQLDRGNVSLSTTMTASAYAASQDPTRLGLNAGDQLTVEDAIKAIVVRSANDVAVVIAETLGGTEYQFAAKMTQKARDLGMTATNFVNASGLPDESQRSTAADLAVLSRKLMSDFPEFYPYFRLQSFVWNGRSYEGHNNLLKFFDGADGLKTGYTRMSGFNLASSATRQGTRLISVVMGGRSARQRDTKTAELLESEFTRLGMGRPAPVIVSMSPLVLDEEEAAAAEEETAAATRPPAEQPARPSDRISQAPSQAGTIASMDSSPREFGQGDTSEPTRAVVPVTGGKWGIQVGAHASRANAETQLKSIQNQMRDLLTTALSAIVPLDVNGDTFYRVRFGSFTPKKAENLCDQIQKRGVSCLVVTDGAWDQSSSRASLPIAVR